MAEEGAEVKFYLDKIRLTLGQANQDAFTALALQILAQAQVNISENGQVDTGFMRASGFVINKAGAKGEPNPSGEYESSRTGDMVSRLLAPAPGLGDAEAAVVFGADYSIWQEMRLPFLLPAAEKVGADAGAIVEPIYKEYIGD